MEKVRITTNNVPRDLLYWYDLTDSEQHEFDYLDSDDAREGAAFFRYRGNVYGLSEFMRVDRMSEFKGWDGYASDSFFSGIVVRVVDDCERVICGWYCS